MSDQLMPGTWQIVGNNSKHNGTLHFDRERAMVGLEVFIEHNFTAKVPRYIELISGECFSGAKVLLVKCECSNPNTNINTGLTHVIYYCDYAFFGAQISNLSQLCTSGVKFSCGNIAAWSGLFRDGGTGMRNSHLSAADPIEMNIRNGARLRFCPETNQSVSVETESTTTTESVALCIDYESLCQWNQVLNDIRCTVQLLELVLSTNVTATSIQYRYPLMANIDDTLCAIDNNHKIDQYADVLVGRGPASEENGRSLYLYESDLALNKLLDYGFFQKWFENYDKLKPVLDLYTMRYANSNVTATMTFLGLTQALETYHARFVSDKVTDYEKKVDAVISSCPSCIDSAELKDFLLYDGGSRGKSIYLRSRIAWLLYANGETPLALGFNEAKDIAEKISDSRNYYTHYDLDKKSKAYGENELPWVNSLLSALLQYHLLVTNNVPVDVAKKICRRISKQARNDFKAYQEAYSS